MSGLIQETKSILRTLGISPRKKFGQNFMINDEALSLIAQLVGPTPGKTILEIGPGLGFLTRKLLESQPMLIAVEKDQILADYLRKNFASHPIKIYQRDVLDLDFKKDLNIDAPIKVVGNIPYNITSPILEWLIEQRKQVSSAVLTTQWEVAQRLTAKPGIKNWGALSVFVQFYSDVEIARKINKNCFYPSPKVDSAVVKINFPSKPRTAVKNEENFFKIVRKAFQKRRKTILNALIDESSQDLSKASLQTALKKTNIDSLRRPETLGILEWARLSDMLLDGF